MLSKRERIFQSRRKVQWWRKHGWRVELRVFAFFPLAMFFVSLSKSMDLDTSQHMALFVGIVTLAASFGPGK